MKQLFCIIFLFLNISAISAADIQFTAEANPASLPNGESFYLTYTLNAAGTNIRLPQISDFEILTPQPDVDKRSFTSEINGTVQQTNHYVYRYVLRAKTEGTFIIAPATITVGGTQHSSNAVTVQVNKQQKNRPSAADYENVFIRLIPSKTSVYEQEAFLLTYRLFAAEANFAGWNNISYPDTKAFVAQEIVLDPNVRWTPAAYNGRQYQSVVFKQQILQAQQAGTLTIGQGRFEAALDIPVVMGGRTVNGRQVMKTLISAPLSINVKPLPAGKPATFHNAVGNFQIASEITPQEPRANEAFTLKITISGNGNFKLFRNPEVNFPKSFERFEPKSDTKIEVNASGVKGSRTIEFLSIPREPGSFVIPPVEFSFFNPETGKYQTLKTQEYCVVVQKGDSEQETANSEQKPENRETKTVNYTLFMMFASVLLAAIFLFIFYRKKSKKNVDNEAIRRKKASAQALGRLKAADKFRKEKNEKAFCDELLKALWGYLSLKLNIPPAELNKENIEEKLRAAGTGEAQINKLLDTLQTAEMIRYAPTQSAAKMDELYEQTLQLMKNVE